MRLRFLVLLISAGVAVQAEDYKGPRPPKADVVYLVHASNLLATEVGSAQQEGKNSDTFSMPGPASTVRTPLAEPIFLLRSEKLKPDTLELYRFEVKNGKRQVTLSSKRKRGSMGPFHMSITKLDRDLYRLEASETLENGEYSLIPNGSNTVFCFEVY